MIKKQNPNSRYTLEEIEKNTIAVIYLSVIITAVPTIIIGKLNDITTHLNYQFYMHLIFIIIAVLILIFNKILSVKFQKLSLLLVFGLAATIGLFSRGMLADGVMYFSLLIIMATFFLSFRGSIIVYIVTILCIGIVGRLYSIGLIKYSFNVFEYAVSPKTWTNRLINMMFYLAIIIFTINKIKFFLLSSINVLQNKNKELTEIYEELRVQYAEVQASKDEIDKLAYYDALTGLPNRVLFSEKVAAELDIAHKTNSTLAIMFFDLDNFKKINDSKGHYVGDIVIKELSYRLKSLLTEKDIVTRMGGDEFIIMLQNINSLNEIDEIALKIMQVMQKTHCAQGYTFHLSASMGIALYPEDGENLEELMKNADTAMYKAKQAGKGNYQYFNNEMKIEMLERIELEFCLRNALENNEIYIEFQPQIQGKTNSIRGVEALMRWKSPSHGQIAPDKFIPILEETGLIVKYGDWILREACFINSQWQKKDFNAITMSVNISPYQLKQGNFVEKVHGTLLETGLEPKYLELEITESIFIEEFDEIIKMLNKLKELGVRISLDDFGTGFSSLNYLRQLPIDTLKIDKSFLYERAIVNTIIELAHNIKLEVVAEGIETQEQLEYLLNGNCDYLQGYYFSRPVSADKIEKMLIQFIN